MNTTKKRILVVDDEESLTRLLKVCLEESGRFDVQVENVATQALETARQFHPDLILLDVMMPEIDGGVLVNQFRENPRFKDVPIVFLTALTTPTEVHQRGGIIGGLPFLAKPVDIPEVIDCLNKQLAA
jgi:CheY-like chemotaxis protein